MGRRLRLDCEACTTKPVMRCGRCTTTRCMEHTLPAGVRCEHCEHDWQEEVPTRRAVKLMIAPTTAVLVGGLLFGLLLPISLGALNTALLCALVSVIAVGVGATTCRLVDRNARSLFLRERAGGLPPARLLPSPRHR